MPVIASAFREAIPAFLLLLPACALSQNIPLFSDPFDDITAWHGVTSHGSASRLALHCDSGRTGRGMLMEYSFLGHMGSAAAERTIGVNLPGNYQIAFDIRGTGLPNNLILRLMDTLGNVWVVNRTEFTPPAAWTRFVVRKDQIAYGWGPSGPGELKELDRIMVMIDVVEGGSGKIWLDNLQIEPLEAEPMALRGAIASSAEPGHEPRAAGAAAFGSWECRTGKTGEWLQVDCGAMRDVGGVRIDWSRGEEPASFDVLLSNDGESWRSAYVSAGASGVRNWVFLGDARTRYVRLRLHGRNDGGCFGVQTLEIEGPEFGFSLNDFYRGIASASPPGSYPRYFSGEQSYWTVVGAPADSRKALMNEEGEIETDMRSFSLEPFLYSGGRLSTWHDARRTQSLAGSYIPIPSVRWETQDSVGLEVTACAAGAAGSSTLLVRYVVENRAARPREGTLFVAMRPFQVDPPWQTFTIVGGVSRIDSIAADSTLRIDGTRVVPVSPPDGMGAARFDDGDITEYISRGVLPPARSASDPSSLASAALRYEWNLRPGGFREVIIAIPYHGDRSPMPGRLNAGNWYARTSAGTAAGWESLLGRVRITLPPAGREAWNTVRSGIAAILMNADGPALQPGARTYRRSWIRDGALTSAALLQMGIDDPVRRYCDWYARYQEPDGKIPAVVEARGPEATPENDSHGEFLYLIREYFAFTHDTAWLAGKWDVARRTVRYIDALRSLRKTGPYVNGTPAERACYGLLPESISHEGYCPAPMHSYWDDFFALRGLRDASAIARVLGESDAAAIAGEGDDLARDIDSSIRRAMENTRVKFIPGCAELGDFAGLSTTVAVTPCQVTDALPPEATAYTFDESYRMFLARKNGVVPWDSYLPYEARFIGAYVLLGAKDRAAQMLEWLMRDRRPQNWNEWAEVVWRDPRAPKGIGDMPHSWAIADFIRSFRTMLAYERDADASLVLCAGIPDAWVLDTTGIAVENLPTHYGPLSFTVRGEPGRVTVAIAAGTDIPPGKIRIASPLAAKPRSIGGEAAPDGRTAIVERLPAHVVFTY
ncbi:MAG TPA: discoidin domain-containing protein [Bacteroidota bacterium]|nr:discoidin domain-containing protein [Bacteroidota bacterium]